MLRARVTDGADLLPAEAEARLEAELARFEAETSHQIAVLTVPELAGEPIEFFALRVAERAELGQRGVDNGILLVVAAKERRARAEVGYGLEGVVPDAVAKRVLEDAIFPRFRAGDYAGGIEAGVESLMRAARGEVVPDDRRARARTELDVLSALFFSVLLSTLVALPLRRVRPLRKPLPFLSGAMSGLLTWILVASLVFAGLGFALGLLFAALVSTAGGSGGRRRRRRGGLFGFPDGGGYDGGFGGGGGGGFGGGGFSGGGGDFGGGGASGSW